ncbi:MAG: hypothetical protein DMF84_18185 [Acidobacteria bacterium]|nr:MAG: hypothetical protein DMF84_18185 [Acidobacteriota bacterium]
MPPFHWSAFNKHPVTVTFWPRLLWSRSLELWLPGDVLWALAPTAIAVAITAPTTNSRLIYASWFS